MTERSLRETAAEAPPSVLLVEGTPDDSILVQEAFRSAHMPNVHQVATVKAAVEAIAAGRPDCVLVDIGGANADGLDAVRVLVEIQPDLPIVVLTGHTSEAAVGMQALQAGAQDYLCTRDITPPILTRVIRCAVARAGFRARTRSSEHVLTRAMANSPIGWSLISADGRHLEVNSTFSKMLGRPPQELIGTRFDDYTHPDDRAEGERTYKGFLEGRYSEVGREKRCLRPDGGVVWVLVHITAVRNDATSEVEYFLVQTQDVTAKHEAEESRARLAALIDGSDDAIYSKDLNGVITSWNPAAERFFGYTPDEVVGKPSLILFPEELGDEARENLERVRNGLSTSPYDTQRLRKDGSLVDVSVVVSPIIDEHGTPIGASTIARDITEQKRARLALERSEERYRRLIEAVQEGIWVFDGSGKTQLVNQRMADILGSSPEELRTRFLWEFIDADPDDDLGDPEAMVSMSARREIRLRRADGDIVWVLLSRAPFTDPEGGAVGSIVSVSDITDRRRVEMMFRTLLEQAPDAMVIVGGAGEIVLVNSEAERVFGYPREELIGRCIEMLIPQPLRAGHVSARTDYGRQPNPRSISHTRGRIYGLRKDGSEFPVEISLSPLQTEMGTLIASAVRDITPRIEQERELEERERRFRAIFDNAQDGMLIVDDDRRYLNANAAATRLLGRPLEELVKLRMQDIAPDDSSATSEAFANFKRTGQASGGFVLVRPDGERRSVEFVSTANILPRQHLSVLRDVTERTLAERERAQLQAQLEQAQRMESVGKLAGGIAHDFNNLLSIILNYAHFANSKTDDSELREELAEIVQAGERAATLTRQLLIFSRRDVVNPDVFDIRAAIEQAVTLMRRTLGERITVETDLPKEPALVELDRGQLDQVLLNLAVNARDAMPEGGRLRFAVESYEEAECPAAADGGSGPGRWVRLRVIDTGSGMSEEVRSRAFEPFFSTKSRETGTGLGLATAYGIVTQSRGGISLKSEVGCGTTVELIWPAAHGEAAEVSAPEESEQPVSGARSVLVVEDEFSIRKLMERILHEHGYHVMSSASAEEALGQARSMTIDLLISDVVMPGMQGPELAETLRAERPELPVLFVSGYAEETAELMSDGHLLPKPFTARELLHAVTDLLSARTGEPVP